MTNTHRKTTNRTTAKIAAVGAFGIGAAIAFPGLAAAQGATTPEGPTASLENLAGEEGSLEGALGTDLALDAGSLALNVNLDAETPNPGSVEFGSLGVSPNTGSALVDGGTGSGSADEDATDDDATETGSLDTGSLPGSSEENDDVAAATAAEADTETGSAASSENDTTATDDDVEETGSIDTGSLAGLSSGADEVAV
ncbi:hypothetical protein [Dietzia aurantiaca]|uniref:Peptidoglycan-binding protein n=1 Tax=Dietzia aurantiaca TaxID=983873 RepID=A0ABV9PS73_9ACTN